MSDELQNTSSIREVKSNSTPPGTPNGAAADTKVSNPSGSFVSQDRTAPFTGQRGSAESRSRFTNNRPPRTGGSFGPQRPAGAPGSFNRDRRLGQSAPRNPDGTPRAGGYRGAEGRDGRDTRRTFGAKKPRNDKRPRQEEQSDLDSQLIEVKRVTRVVKGGKRMRFAALVVVGDRKGQVGMGFMKGMDFQDAVAKATRKAKDNLIKVTITEDRSISFPIQFKYKAAQFLMKPATKGTGLIAGGYLRPVLELVGVENIYTKILGSNNKIAGVQAVIQALQKFN